MWLRLCKVFDCHSTISFMDILSTATVSITSTSFVSVDVPQRTPMFLLPKSIQKTPMHQKWKKLFNIVVTNTYNIYFLIPFLTILWSRKRRLKIFPCPSFWLHHDKNYPNKTLQWQRTELWQVPLSIRAGSCLKEVQGFNQTFQMMIIKVTRKSALTILLFSSKAPLYSVQLSHMVPLLQCY